LAKSAFKNRFVALAKYHTSGKWTLGELPFAEV